MSYVVAIDPGKVTGWARLLDGVFASGELPCYQALHWIYESLKQGIKPILVCEDFIFTHETLKKSRQMWSTESIGVLRFLAEEFDLHLHLQPPSQKSFSSDDKLRMLGWYKPSPGGHQNDAARHLLVYGVKNGLISVRNVLQ